MKLSKTCQELLDAIKNGVVVHYVTGIDAYYFRNDTHRTCTKTIEILFKNDLVERYDQDWRGCSIRLKDKDVEK